MAYTGNSISDYLSSIGQANDYNSRAKLASQYGISGYTGSAQQNTSLLNTLRGNQTQSAPVANPVSSNPGSNNFEDVYQQNYKGWGRTEAMADWNAKGRPGVSGSSSSGGNSFEETLKRAQELQRQANEPIINSLQSSIPGIQQQYATQKSNLEAKKAPLKARYDNLISEIKGNQTVAENRQTVTTNNELGRRGILGSSGLAQQEITNAVNPITKGYTTLAKDTGLAGESALQGIDEQISGLSSQEIDTLRNVQNAIAQAQTSGNQQALSSAQQIVSQAQQQAAQDRALELQQKQQQFENDLATKKYNLSAKESSNGLDLQAFIQQYLQGGGGQAGPVNPQGATSVQDQFAGLSFSPTNNSAKISPDVFKKYITN